MPFDPVLWTPQEIITSDKLNKMVENDKFLRNRKVAGALRNMDQSGNESQNMRYLKENLILVCGYKEFKPGSSFPDSDNEGIKHVAAVFERTFPFPKRTFSPLFRPVVLATVGTKRGIKRITYTLKRIETSEFVISIRDIDPNLNFTDDMEYFCCWMAMGVSL